VQGFFANDARTLITHNYCRVFVLPHVDDTSKILGYYTLAPTALKRSRTSTGEQRKIPPGLPVPMMLIGFMGRDDTAPKGTGSALLVDAARRVHRNPDIAAWGLMLDSEGGQGNKELWKWYQDQVSFFWQGSCPAE
jgi:hypothetical protein